MAAQALMAWAAFICLMLGICWSAPAVLAGSQATGSDEAAMNDTTELCHDSTVDRQFVSWLSGLVQGFLDRLSGSIEATACSMNNNTMAFGKKHIGAPHSAFAMINHDVVSGSAISKSGDLDESFDKHTTRAVAYVSCPSKQAQVTESSGMSASFTGALDIMFQSSRSLALSRRGGSTDAAQRVEYLGFNRPTYCY